MLFVNATDTCLLQARMELDNMLWRSKRGESSLELPTLFNRCNNKWIIVSVECYLRGCAVRGSQRLSRRRISSSLPHDADILSEAPDPLALLGELCTYDGGKKQRELGREGGRGLRD